MHTCIVLYINVPYPELRITSLRNPQTQPVYAFWFQELHQVDQWVPPSGVSSPNTCLPQFPRSHLNLKPHLQPQRRSSRQTNSRHHLLCETVFAGVWFQLLRDEPASSQAASCTPQKDLDSCSSMLFSLSAAKN